MSEEQILQEIEKLSPHDAYIRGRCDMWDAISSNDRKEILAEIEQILRNLEKVKSMTRRCWIPVSERFPEDGQRVLVDYCDEDMGIMLMRFNAHGYRGFKAWMPLPLPYKASPTGAEKEG